MVSLGTWRRRWAGLVLAACAAPALVRAQASPYVPLGDVAYRYIAALQARGELRALSLLVRPYTVAQVRRALGPAAGEAGQARSQWRVDLEHSLARWAPPADAAAGSPAASDPWALAALNGGVTGQTSALRELMLADDSSGVWPGAAFRMTLGAGPVVAAVRLGIDERLKHDPEFAGSKTRSVTGRTDDAYVSGQWTYGELTFGRLARNWGPAAADGLQLGAYAYSVDHLYGKLGVPALNLSTVIARLNDMQFGGDSTMRRYLAIHRLGWRARGVEGSFAESVVYGGIGRPMEWPYLNPLNFYALSQYNEAKNGNVAFLADVAWRARGGRAGVWSAQVLLDDFQIDRCNPACKEPSSYGVTLSAEGLPLGGDQRLFGSYTRVSALTYGTPLPWETYQVNGVGIGRGFSDYDEVRGGIELAVPGLPPLRAYGAFRRQGEGDYRLPYPPVSAYPTVTGFLSGVVMKVARVGLSGGVALPGGLIIDGDVGFNHATNALHVAGKTTSGAEGRITVTLEPGVLVRRGRLSPE
jgi:hypothetical protein